jgi:trk system potassium uptake protein TrkA
MRIVIAGCGRVGRELATSLADDGHDVTVIDNRPHALEELGKSFNGTTVTGQAYDVDTLRRAGIEVADVFAAVTDSDNANLMAVEVAKEVFGIKRSIARLYDPARESSYRALGIRHVTGTKLIAQVIFEQIVDDAFHYHVEFVEGDVEIVEFTLGANCAGMRIEDIETRDWLRVAAVRRGSRTHVPSPGFVFASGDLVVAAAREGVRPRIEKYLAPEDER